MDYEDVTILTKDDIKLKGWFLKRPTSYEKASTIVFFHENAGNIGTRL